MRITYCSRQSGDNTELTGTASRNQASVTLIRLAVSTNHLQRFGRARSSHPFEVHLTSTNFLPALVAMGPHFRKHPELDLPEMDIGGPGLQGGRHNLVSLSFKSSGSGLPSKSNTRQPGVSR